ncbi:MAG: putative radial spoke head protein 6, partial [Streblomastix strix]
ELMHELRKFGVGLGEEETLQIQQHIQTHFSTLNLKQVRLFAKIIGLEKDYYVVQGEPVAEFVEEEGDAEEEGKTGAEGEEEKTGEEQEEEAKEEEEGGEEAPGEPQIDADPDEPPTPQPRKLTLKEEIPKEEREDKTPNQYIYWVSNGPTDTWKRLPDITPKQIVAARQQSYTLTGNLNAKVNEGYPVFPGREKHYLRAQLARILHQTSLIPKPPPKKKEGEEEEEGNEEEGEITEKPVEIGPLVEGEGWILERPPILVQGRVKKYPPIGEGEEEGTGAEEEEDEEKIDPKKKERKLKLLEAKKEQERGEVWERIDEEGIELEGINGKHPTFSIRTDEIQGDKVVLVKNNIWPGSFTVAYGGRRGRIGNIYIGNGKKYTGLPFTPIPPPILPDEFPDVDETDDPTLVDEDKVKADIAAATGKDGKTEEEGEEEAAEEAEEAES